MASHYKTFLKRLRKENAARVAQVAAEEGVDSSTALEVVLDRAQPLKRRERASLVVRGPLSRSAVARAAGLLRAPESEQEAWILAGLFSQTKTRAATRPLLALVKDHNQEPVQVAAIHALQRLRDKRAVRFLVAFVGDAANTENVRAPAHDALVPFSGQPKVRRALIAGLKDPSPTIRAYCLHALAHVDRDEVREAILPLVNDTGVSWEGDVVGEVAHGILGRVAAGFWSEAVD